MADADEKLRQATAALEDGQKGEARELLREVLARDSENEEAWLLMSRAAPTNRQRLMCLEAMFDINRGNEATPVDRAGVLGRYQTAGLGAE